MSPEYPPPGSCPGSPRLAVVSPGALLWRIHETRFEPAGFNPTDPDSPEAGGGGRFDSPGGRPPFLYAASSVEASVAEALLRDLPFPPDGQRELPRFAVAGRSVSQLAVVREIEVVALHGEGLAQVGQDGWLVACAGSSYASTRGWGARVREWRPDAAGLEWRSRHCDDEMSYVLYEDVASEALRRIRTERLDTPEGLALIRPALRRLNVAPPLL